MYITKNVKPVFVLLAAAALLPFTSSAQDPKTSRPAVSDPHSTGTAKVSDQAFISEAADGGMAEVELGKLAQEKAASPEVKQFGERMATDHQKANDQLKQIASQKGVQLPSEPSPKHKATMDRLSKLSGEQFDKAYMSDMLKDHKKDVAAFKRESTSGRDPDVKQFATETLPTLQEHLKQAETIAPKVQSGNKSAASNSPSSR